MKNTKLLPVYVPFVAERKAEGTLNGVPFDTWIAGSQGCGVHFWLGSAPSKQLANELRRAMTNFRDVIECTYSSGQPAGFWANEKYT